MSAKTTAKKINVNFSPDAYAVLENLAEAKGKTMSEVLRDAIALEKWFAQTTKEGGRILVERPDGKVREIVPR
jgi:Ribbon-helix-helix protein, copG family